MWKRYSVIPVKMMMCSILGPWPSEYISGVQFKNDATLGMTRTQLNQLVFF